MSVTQETTINVVCDNPACPGNDLDPTDRTGWTFINSEVYGEPTAQRVFCSAGCVSAFAADVQAGTQEWANA
jgi:hypothetical protein